MRRGPLGFTLFALLVVILVMGILVTIGTIAYGQFTNSAYDARAKTNLTELAHATMVRAVAGSHSNLP